MGYGYKRRYRRKFKRYYRRKYRRSYGGGGASKWARLMYQAAYPDWYQRKQSAKRRSQIVRAAARAAKQAAYNVEPAAFGEKGNFDLSTIGLSGKGDYTLGAGSSFGSRVGAWLGDRAGGFLGRITGLGSYQGAGVNDSADPPAVRNSALREIVISHREYICDIITSGTAGAFKLQNFMLNPGSPLAFPWLSSLAPNFQEWKLNGCVFEFKSMSADALNSTNTALGQVICATNYNVNMPNYQSKYEMENSEFGSSCKPSCSFMHPIECDRRVNLLENLLVAAGGVTPTGGDPNFYQHANFQIATNGFQGTNVNIGELWVTYEIIFYKPIQPEANGGSGNFVMDLEQTYPASQFGINAAINADTFSTQNSQLTIQWQYPPSHNTPNAAKLQALEYYVTTSGTTFTVQSVQQANDSYLVGRYLQIHFELIHTNGGAGIFPAGSGSWSLSSNLSVPLAPIVANNPGMSGASPVSYQAGGLPSARWAADMVVLVSGPGPLVFSFPAANTTSVAATQPVTARYWINEIPAVAMLPQ